LRVMSISMKRSILPTLVFSVAVSLVATAKTPPDVWKNYDPDAGDFKEEMLFEETKDGVYYKDACISATINGEGGDHASWADAYLMR
jgi:hypothetical protein